MNSLCNQTAWLEQGELHVLGETSAVVGDYLRTTVPSVRGCEIHFDADTSKPAQLRRARIMNQRRDITDRFSCDETVVVELLMQVHRPIPGLYGYFEIVRNDGVKIMMSDSYDACPNPLDNLEVGLHKTCITIPQRTLGPGEYSVYLNFTSLFADGYQVDGPGTIGTFVLDDHTSRRGNARPGFFSTLLEWQTTPVPEHVLS
jgi:lipopolysaccharide transport system ATP-binding protein